ncbi:MAG: TonB-dependent receptor plug domain-containing protein [Reichenbachiella sp.]|uniref:TonB-dependent receptor plug domain-containing protein n=1 Tax=Reichenbachiella sp. TaxID=2184521 RepID=UPI003299B632
MTARYYLPFILLALSYNIYAQSPYLQALENYTAVQSQEKVYLHLDNSQYIAGETIWLKAYVVNATSHLHTQTSKTLYVELIDSARHILDSLELFIENGTCRGSLNLAPDIPSGLYRIRAYTQWMRNFDDDLLYRQEFHVLNTNDSTDSIKKNTKTKGNKKISIDFLPEGGDFLGGIATKVAIRSTDQHGRGKSEKGVIVNQKGQHITSFETNKQGYGLIFFTPIAGDSYYALTAQSQLNLPEVKTTGAVIRATHSHTSNKVMFSVLAKNLDLKGGTLVMHKRGQWLLSQECPNNDAFAVSINKSDLGSGIINVTFFDKNQIPLTERLIFPNPPSHIPTINIATDQNEYQKRSKVNLTLSSAKNTVHSASITINPMAESSYKANGRNIENYLLFTSDLKGKIESPNNYFQESKEAYLALDLVMLTHGWSRFDWVSLLDESQNFSPTYFPEEGLKIVGKASNYYNDKDLKGATLGVSIPSLGVLNETTSLSEDGSFQIDGFSLMDSTSIYLQVYKEQQGKNEPYRKASIHLEGINRPDIRPFLNNSVNPNKALEEKAQTLEQISKLYFIDENVRELDEVIIKARSLKQEEIAHRTLYTNPSHRMMLDSMKYNQGARSIFDLLRNIPGINVTGTFPFQSASFARSNTSIASTANNAPTSANGNSPLYVVDGMPADEDLVNSIPLQNVEFIDVLKGPRAAIYGSRVKGGAILIYTRQDGSGYPTDISPEGFYGFIHPGYHQAKEFYSPRYDTPKDEHRIPDFRTTLYWNPELTFENGKSEMDFYTSDQSGPFTIRLEGILTNGEPFFEENVLFVE